MNRNQLIKVFFMADYKEQDRKKIIDFLMSNGGTATVNDILAYSGAEKLRVYPILIEEHMAGKIDFQEEEYYGAPKVVRLI